MGEWLLWRSAVPVLLNGVSMLFAILAAGRVYTASRQPAGTDTSELNKEAASLGAVAISLQSIAYFIEKAVSP